jgi:hypothetical protein
MGIKNPVKDFCSEDLDVRPSVVAVVVVRSVVVKWLVGPCRTINRATSFLFD